jgi:HK97 family phage prohead protease
MRINMPMVVTAADTVKRTISGTIVTWNEQGNTSVGPTVFAANSIEMKPVKLLLEHDRTRPIGKLMSHEVTKDGIVATFKIANTMAGEDALIEATEGLRDGFSVGAQINEWVNAKGVMQITAATLDEVSLVTDPAIDSARVSEVAASENEAPEDSAPATAEEDKPTEGEQVSDTTVPAPAEETVEAAKVEAAAPRPAFYTAPRLEFTKAKYLEASVRSKVFGDDESRQYVMAADDTTSNNAGLIPTRQLTEVINPLSNADRSTIDAISKGVLPDAGMTFEIPKITAVPTVADVNEAQPIGETGMTNNFLTVNVNKYAGGQTFSVELLDRSNPLFFEELVRQMEYAYALATDQFVAGALLSNGQAAATAVDNTAAGLLGFVAEASAEVYKDSLGFARNIIVTPEQWAKIMSYNDAGRPIYNASQPQNAGGVVTPDSLRGQVAGLNLYVSRALGSLTVAHPSLPLGDGSMIVVNPDAYTWYESSRFRLQTNVALNGQIEVAYYGYGALAVKIADGAVYFNKN